MKSSRRLFLRGTGAALGLPWLESICAFGAESVKNNTAPRRLAVCFTGNGVNPHHWGADTTPSGMALKNPLPPLKRLKTHINVSTSLDRLATAAGEGGQSPKTTGPAGLTRR